MIRAAALIGAAIGTVGISAAAAEPLRLPATDFSSQQVIVRGKKPVGAPVGRVAPAGRVAPQVNVNRNVNRNVQINRGGGAQIQRGGGQQFQRGAQPQIQRGGGQQFQRGAQPQIQRGGGQQFQRGAQPQIQRGPSVRVGAPGVGVRVGAPGVGVRVGVPGAAVRFGAGPGRVVPYRAVNHPMVVVGGGRSAAVWRGPRRLYWGNRWRTFVPVAAIGAVAIGGAYYYADSYLSLARPYCSGVTPEGCRLNWQRVEFEDGDGDWQCVQFCPRPGAPPPQRTVAFTAPPPVTQGSCEVAIFSEPDFQGTNATSTDEQPRLSELGWQNQIASIRVVSGTWDFFTDPDFTGEVVRYGPGEYPDLGPDWSRRTSSFMCVQP